MNQHVKWIWNRWKVHPRFILLLFFMTLLSSSVAISYPYAFKFLFDTVEKVLGSPEQYTEPMQEIYKVIWVLVAIGVSSMFAQFYPAFRALMNTIFEKTIRNEYFAEIIDKNHKFFQKFKTGDLITRLTDDLVDYSKLSWFMCSGIFRAFDSFFKVLFCLIVMFFLNWKLTILAIIPLPIMIGIFYLTQEKIYDRFKKNQEAISNINSQLELSFSGVRVIKAFVCEDKYKRFFHKALDRRFHTELAVVKLETILHLIYEYIEYFAQIGIIIFGGYMVVQGDISIGDFYAFYTYIAILIYPILDIPVLFVSGKRSFVNIDRLEDIKNTEFTSKDENANKKTIESIESIEFRNVSFAYDEKSAQSVKNLSFKASKGDKLLLMGEIGCGKTTVLKLLTGLVKADSGEVLINGIHMEELDLHKLREKIGYVPQEALLFSGSIYENIAFGKEDLDEASYQKAVETSQMHEEIEQFYRKDETIIGQRGSTVSGGQKQRLAMARALARNPELLILDDITASLDAENEEKLWLKLNIHYANLSCFMVSHRTSTIQYADSILFMENGELTAKGTHAQLLKHAPYQFFVAAHK